MLYLSGVEQKLKFLFDNLYGYFVKENFHRLILFVIVLTRIIFSFQFFFVSIKCFPGLVKKFQNLGC